MQSGALELADRVIRSDDRSPGLGGNSSLELLSFCALTGQMTSSVLPGLLWILGLRTIGGTSDDHVDRRHRSHARPRDSPDAPAIEFEGRTITFGELDARSNQLANALAGVGVGARRPGGVPRQERPRVLRGHVRARRSSTRSTSRSTGGWRRAEIAQIINDAARQGRSSSARSSCRTSRRSKPTSRRSSTIVAIGGHARWRDYEELARRARRRRSGRAGGAATTSRSSSTRRARPGCRRA